MTEKLETVLEKVSTIPNPVNSSLIQEFYQFMADNRKSDSYKKNNLKALVLFSHELGPYERRLLAFLSGIDKTCDDFVELAKTSP
jgi:hypothetical protein